MRAIIRKLGGLILGLTLLCGALSSTAAAHTHFRVYLGYGPPSYYYYPQRYVYYYPTHRYVYYYPRYYYPDRYYYTTGFYWRHHHHWRHYRYWR